VTSASVIVHLGSYEILYDTNSIDFVMSSRLKGEI